MGNIVLHLTERWLAYNLTKHSLLCLAVFAHYFSVFVQRPTHELKFIRLKWFMDTVFHTDCILTAVKDASFFYHVQSYVVLTPWQIMIFRAWLIGIFKVLLLAAL